VTKEAHPLVHHQVVQGAHRAIDRILSRSVSGSLIRNKIRIEVVVQFKLMPADRLFFEMNFKMMI
jgi:hypothetical protein